MIKSGKNHALTNVMVLVNVQACMLLFPRGCVCFKCYNTRCGCAFLLGAFLWLGPRFPLTFPNYALKPSARPETLYVEDLCYQLLAVASNPWETERVFQHCAGILTESPDFLFPDQQLAITKAPLEQKDVLALATSLFLVSPTL